MRRRFSGSSQTSQVVILSIRHLLILAQRSASAAVLIVLPWWQHWIIVRRPTDAIPFHELTDLSLYLTDALLVVAIAAWLLGASGRPALPGWLRWPLLALPLLALALTPAAPDPALALYHTVRLALVTLWALSIAATPWLQRWAPACLLTGAALQASIVLLQVIRQQAVGLGFVGEVPLSQQLPGVSVIYAAGVRWLRPYGLTQHPNILAGCLAVALLLALAVVMTHPLRWRWAWFSGLALTGLALALTFSRSAWVGAALGALLIGSHALLAQPEAQRRRLLWRVLTPLLGLSLIFALLTWPILASRLGLTGAGTEARSVNERVVLIVIAWRQFVQAPWPGVGLAQFTHAIVRDNADLLGPYTAQPVHLVPLLAAVELGPAGALLWLWLTWAPLGAWLRRRPLPAALAGPTAALLALIIIGLFEYYPFQATQGRLLTWTVWGLWGAAWTAHAQSGAAPPVLS